MIYEDDDGFLKWMDLDWIDEGVPTLCDVMEGLSVSSSYYYLYMGGIAE